MSGDASLVPERSRPGFERRAADWLTAEAAQERILSSAAPLPVEDVPLDASGGRILVERIEAPLTLPQRDNSAMDGYAVRAEDVRGASPQAPVRLDVVGRVHAGSAWTGHTPGVRGGQAGRIMTGAPLPSGADAVVRVEDTDGERVPGSVAVQAPVEAGRYVRPAGEDFQRGDVLVRPGTRIDGGVVAVAAAVGRSTLSCPRRPVAALLATGDELRDAGRFSDVIEGAGVPESNTPMLAAMVRQAGARPRRLGIAADEASALDEKIAAASDADLLVTIGGASMGEADLVKGVLDARGFRLDFWRVRMRPGSPFAFGTLPRPEGALPVFSLPGNPASAFVTFEIFVRPFLRALSADPEPLRSPVRCEAAEDLTGPGDLSAYLRVRLDHDAVVPRAKLTGPQGSGLVRGLGLADGLAVLPVGTARIRKGEPVDVLLLRNAPSRPKDRAASATDGSGSAGSGHPA